MEQETGDRNFELELEKLKLDRYKADLDYRKFRLGSVFAAVAIAAIPPLFQLATAGLEYVKSNAEREAKQQTFRDEYIKDFISNALNQDIELRIRFAQYFARVATEPSRNDWVEYLSDLKRTRTEIREQIDKLEIDWQTMTNAANHDKAEIDKVERNLAWAYKEVGYLEPNRSAAVNPRAPEGFTPKDASDLLSRFEGTSLIPIKDPTGRLNIGSGHLVTDSELEKGTILIGGKEVPFTDGLTEDQARLLLEQDIQPIRSAVASLVSVPLTPGQLDALVVFAWQVGIRNFEKSSVLKKVNAGLYEEVPKEMRRWIKVQGSILPGLVKRREAEISLWGKPAQ